jgi:hypothetical protein
MANILMIEDDAQFASLLTDYLARYNLVVTNFQDPFLGLSAGIEQYDLLIEVFENPCEGVLVANRYGNPLPLPCLKGPVEKVLLLAHALTSRNQKPIRLLTVSGSAIE